MHEQMSIYNLQRLIYTTFEASTNVPYNTGLTCYFVPDIYLLEIMHALKLAYKIIIYSNNKAVWHLCNQHFKVHLLLSV